MKPVRRPVPSSLLTHRMKGLEDDMVRARELAIGAGVLKLIAFGWS